MSRTCRAQADTGCDVIVSFGAIDQSGEAAFGEFCAGIVDSALDHFIIAAQHEHVSDRTAQHPARRNRHQMRLALIARGLDQGVIVEPFRFGQHGCSDLDEIVECQRANGERRRAIDRS